ncbi:LysR family transcriptional regulator [Ostreiculturibacter nitratireducens]|uniref:LysR family transcriptional regulator n=1 Tax=Ostreiculturibacter nitratireducens TaxID=3075226 RepID=UPI0031B64057
MSQRRHRIPSASALVAFECVARLGGVGRAAEELNTSQSAISRHLKHLEDDLGVRLFERSGRGITLTPAGNSYFLAARSALETLTSAGHSLRLASRDVTIACTHEVSHLLLMPVFGDLRRAIGKGVHVRITTCEYDAIPAMIHAGADIVFQYSESAPHRRSVTVVDESITPVAAPSFIEAHAGALRGAPSGWDGVPLLALTKNNFGWATWEDWFSATGVSARSSHVETYDNYVYLLEAAAAGTGLALGWKGFVDRYVASGTLEQVCDYWVERRSRLHACLTKKGESNENAAKCLAFLATICA